MKRVGLALGGGGARGVAHIAYIKAMEEMGVRPSIIAGTSSGAIVGALYAGGMSPDQMYSMLQTLFRAKTNKRNPFKGMKDMPSGLISSVAKNYLFKIVPRHTFEELDIPLKMVATNFHTLEEKVFTNGDIFGPLMSSSSFPSTFSPQLVEGEYYIDGGATNIVPFDIIRDDCDILIAIDVSKVRPNNYKPKKNKALKATWAATQEALISLKLKYYPVDLFERPSFGNVATMEFYKYKRVYDTAQQYVPEFKKKLEKLL